MGGIAKALRGPGAGQREGDSEDALDPSSDPVPVRPPLPPAEAAEAARLEAAYGSLVDAPDAPALVSGAWDGGESPAFLRIRRAMGLEPEPPEAVEAAREAAWRRGLFQRAASSRASSGAAAAAAAVGGAGGEVGASATPAGGAVIGAAAASPPPPDASQPPHLMLLQLGGVGAKGRRANGGAGTARVQRRAEAADSAADAAAFELFPTYETCPDVGYGALNSTRPAAEGGGAASGIYVFGGLGEGGAPLGDHFVLRLFAAAASPTAGGTDRRAKGGATGGGGVDSAGPDIIAVWDTLPDLNAGPAARAGAAAVVVTSSPAESGLAGYAEAVTAGSLPFPASPAPGAQWVLLFGGAQQPPARVTVAADGGVRPPSPAALLHDAMQRIEEEDRAYMAAAATQRR